MVDKDIAAKFQAIDKAAINAAISDAKKVEASRERVYPYKYGAVGRKLSLGLKLLLDWDWGR